jgi:bifunctional DNA-binding transcriptional regulator/antitoxin component of YhaV-PrlF toxin-antitoxin module
MSTIQMHYDGWLTLPAAVRQRLSLGTGDRLELELAGDTVVLRRAQRSSAVEPATTEPEPMQETEPQPVEAAAEAPAPAAAPEPVVKRGPGRPRKTPVTALPQSLKTRGRRKAEPVLEAQSA